MNNSSSATHKLVSSPSKSKDISRLFKVIKNTIKGHDVQVRNKAILKLQDRYKVPMTEIRKKTGLSLATLYNSQSLNDFPPQVQAVINDGVITFSQVLELKRNQISESEFITSVRNKVKELKAGHKSNTSLERKIELLNKRKVTPEKTEEIKNGLTSLIGRVLGVEISKRDAQLMTHVIQKLI